jgi:DNA-directed RNA polymerase subunit M/transcription elongation factor TFIIS
MSYCPCCSNLLLQHIRGSELYWFCRHCWQEMPVFMDKNSGLFLEDLVEDSPKILAHRKRTNAEFATNKRLRKTGWIGVQDISA